MAVTTVDIKEYGSSLLVYPRSIRYAIDFWHPIASNVTIYPLRHNIHNSGGAVIS